MPVPVQLEVVNEYQGLRNLSSCYIKTRSSAWGVSRLEALSRNIKGIISPKLEIGAFEALWDNGISSFKQLRDKLHNEDANFASEVVDIETALHFYKMTLERLNKNGVEDFGVRIDGTSDYPNKLHDADHPLFLLYFQGIWDLALTRGVAVVGTRKPSTNGKIRAKNLVTKLVEKGYTIYSGLASGIDTVAHKTAIAEGGKTVAIIGTPLSHNYPRDNYALQKEISTTQLLISQVPVIRYDKNDLKFNRFYFPERNKTMSAMSEATVIVEASETSGTLIQARAALQQGRKVFILNNCFENPLLTWPKKFEQRGAIRVREFEDIGRVLDSGL